MKPITKLYDIVLVTVAYNVKLSSVDVRNTYEHTHKHCYII